MATIAFLLEFGAKALAAHEVARLEAQVLLAFVLGCDRAYLYTWPEKEIPAEKVTEYEALLSRRLAHEPIAYIVGEKEFWSLPFKVTRDTLIPRHDTELLVKTVLAHLPETKMILLDVGTGCGNIACALAHERSAWDVMGVDVSQAAIDVAIFNANKLQIKNVQFMQSNWLAAIQDKQFDAIVGNPPYIRGNDVHLVHGDLPFEPTIALTPGTSGLEAFQAILAACPRALKPQGLIAFEHGFDQGEAVSALLTAAGFQDIRTYRDYAGNQRVTSGVYSRSAV
jgi:release factor glutamine methyltransferase